MTNTMVNIAISLLIVAVGAIAANKIANRFKLLDQALNLVLSLFLIGSAFSLGNINQVADLVAKIPQLQLMLALSGGIILGKFLEKTALGKMLARLIPL